MAQNKYSFDGYTPTRQPTEVVPAWATTSTADSGRSQFGKMNNKVMFSVQAFTITFAENLYATDMKRILQAVLNKSSFMFHYFSPYYGEWRTDKFYVANIDCSAIQVKDGREFIQGLTLQVTDENPM